MSDKTARLTTGASPIDVAQREALMALVRERGERGAVEAMGIGRHTLERALAGFNVRRGTAALIRERLHDMSVQLHG